ncbi:MAG: SH3 domain-containing protein [Dehalococcoidia bacterium]
MTLHRQLRLSLLSLPALLTLFACGGSSPEPTSEPTAAATVAPTPRATATPRWPEVARATITTDDLNVRSGPGAAYPVVGRLQPDDVVPVSARLAGAEWLALPGIGWIVYSEDWTRLSTEFSALPEITEPSSGFEFTGPVYPADARSGIPVVDEVLAAIVSRDRARLLALASAAPSPSPTLAAPTSTPVPTLVPDVTETATATREAGPDAESCSDGPISAASLREYLDAFYRTEVPAAARGGDGQGVLRLYGVVRAPVPENGLPDYVLVVAFEGGEARQLWVSPDGRLTQFTLPCEPTLPGSLLRVTSGEPFFWFRPAVSPPVHELP